MSNKVPERIMWAVDTLEVRQDDQILEVGCGRGFAIGPVCRKLLSGKLIAIDRSAKMADVAAKRNAEQVASGKAIILHTDLLNASLPALHFDKIFFFNLNVFWMDPVDELQKITSVIKPDGNFYIFHQPPPGHDPTEFAAAFQKNLTANGFVIQDVLFKKLEPVAAACVISRPG